MAIFLFIVLPVCCALLGKLVGLAVAASTFFSDNGKQLGKSISHWCVPLFPIVFLVAMAAGARGNAGFGFALFGSQTLFELACVIPFWGVPVFAVYVGALYVIRDLTLGHGARS